jgi:hypothetical protein
MPVVLFQGEVACAGGIYFREILQALRVPITV